MVLNILKEKEIIEIIINSLEISTFATIISFIFSFLFSFYVIKRENYFFLYLTQTFLFIPTVTIGLLLYILFNRSGIFGFLGILYTKKIMIIGQSILIFPLISFFLISGLKEIYKNLNEIMISLCADFLETLKILLKEGRYFIFSSIVVGLSRSIGETGLAMIVGGNIKGQTRVFTTAITLFTMRGEFEIALSLGLILLFISLILNFLFLIFQRKWKSF